MNFKKLAIIAAALTIGTCTFAACSGGDKPDKPTPGITDTNPGGTTPEKPNPGGDETDPSLKDITGVTFTGSTVTYDGTEHTITVSGTLPEGVSVQYNSNSATNAGTYNATATLSGEGYKTLTLNATLTVNKADITGVTFTGDTVTYDGNAHTITVNGTLPDGVSVQYKNNSATNAGTYEATATLSGANYNTLTLNATLTVNKAEFTGITFANASFAYDGTPHTIEIAGALPQGTTVTYSCAENSGVTNSATETGTYTITATVTNPNYNDKQYTATLTIKASEKERHIAYHNGVLYFANALHNDYLYSYDGQINKVSVDVPMYFTQLGSDLYFRSNATFGSSIKAVSSDASVSAVAAVNGKYLCTDGTNIYFAVNALTNAKSGIYKMSTVNNEPQLISEGKAEYLQYASGYLYFADGANGGKLSKISVSGGTRQVVRDEKINCLTYADGYLYYTVNNLLGDYIENYNVSRGVARKLTQDAGANLTKIGNFLYYLNVDKLTSMLYGGGIYRVNATPAGDSNSHGEKIVGEEGESYSSLTAYGNDLAYYKVSNQMLCKYVVSTQTETELLAGFVAPETTPISTGSKTLAYGNTLYYLDLYNDKALYSYNTLNKTFARITSNKVVDFSIIGDKLYYNSVSKGVDNDLYVIDLKNGGEPERVSSSDCNEIISDGTNLFYVEENAGGVATAIHIIKPDGTDEIMYSKGAENLVYYEGYLYFLDGKDLLKMPVMGYTVDQTTTVKKGNTGTFVISNGVIYYRRMYGIGWASKCLARINIDGTGDTDMMVKNTDPLEIHVVGDKVYYYNDVTLGTSGLYCIDITAKEDKEPTLILECASTYYAANFTVMNGHIYFVNYRMNLGDSHLYGVEIATGDVERLDK